MADMKWIPVTERLPEVSGRYLVIDKQTFHHESTSFVDLLFFIDGKHDPWNPQKEISNGNFGKFGKLPDGFIGWAYQDDNFKYCTLLDVDEFNREEVTAWMPLPEPCIKSTPASNDDDTARYVLKKRQEIALKELEGAWRLAESLHKMHSNN